jgi:hypothetical protein
MRASEAAIVMLKIFRRITNRRFAYRVEIHIALLAAMSPAPFG